MATIPDLHIQWNLNSSLSHFYFVLFAENFKSPKIYIKQKNGDLKHLDRREEELGWGIAYTDY